MVKSKSVGKTVRLDPKLWAKLKKKADGCQRSMNNYIERALERDVTGGRNG